MEVLKGKPSINGPFSMAMLNNQRVIVLTFWGGPKMHKKNHWYMSAPGGELVPGESDKDSEAEAPEEKSNGEALPEDEDSNCTWLAQWPVDHSYRIYMNP
jgi:hypothetical protein